MIKIKKAISKESLVTSVEKSQLLQILPMKNQNLKNNNLFKKLPVMKYLKKEKEIFLNGIKKKSLQFMT